MPQPKTQEAVTRGGSALERYRRVVVGRPGLGALLYFELCAWLAGVPGAAGLALRRAFWPRLFGACGAGTVFGAGVTLRHPHRVRLGERVVVADGCVLDARTDADVVIDIGDDSILGNDVTISCKGGRVRVGRGAGLGTRTVIHAVAGAEVSLGADLIVGPGCYIAGGGNYNASRLDLPMARQGVRPGESTELADDVWLGAHVIVLPGARVGAGSIGAAGAVIRGRIPPRTIVGGVPARVIGRRGAAGAVPAAEGGPEPGSGEPGAPAAGSGGGARQA